MRFFSQILLLLKLFTFCFLAGCSSTHSLSNASNVTPSGCDVAESCASLEAQDPAQATAELVADFKPISFSEAIDFFKEKKSGLLYFGFVNCPWCQELVPILHELTRQENVPVYYIETRNRENTRLYSDEERDKISPYLKEFIKENKEGTPTLYVPLVVAVENGEVIAGHQGTTSDHNAHEEKLSEAQKELLQNDLQNLIHANN